MNLLSIEEISKSYGEKILFDAITFGIDENDKIGIIGVNGTGKSTFLKVIAGLEPPDEGKISVGNRVVIQYLAQDPVFEEDATVLEQVFQGDSAVMRTLRAYGEALEALNREPGNETLQKRLIEMSQQMDAQGAWQLESEAKTVLMKLGIGQFDAKVGTLSGGQRKRIALASALIQPSDLLILDEPTNHIDNESVDWLESYLNKRKGALLMITHDRYFLDRVVNRIFELDQGKLYSYDANYSRFLELKMEREEREAATEQKRANLLRNELAWIRRGAKARTTKQKARIDRFEKLQDEAATVNRGGKMDVSVSASRLGKKVIEIEHLTKSYADRSLIRDFEYIVMRDDRVGIIGANGSGKSTLLNMIAGRIMPDGGTIDIGPTVRIGYFSQENKAMDPNQRVIDHIKEAAEIVRQGDGSTATASQMLERFLFPPNLQWSPISKLSGGEKRRLHLLRVLVGAPNVLLLDEPTNDLDIQTLTVLEDYLDDFPGAVIVVSHDRYFLDRTVDKIIAFEGNGVITHNVGNYSEYREFQARKGLDADGGDGRTDGGNGRADGSQLKTAEPPAERKKERGLRFSYQEQKEYEKIDDMIAEAEAEQLRIAERMNDAGSDSVLLQSLLQEQEQIEKKLEHLLERWTYLNELAEQIAQSQNK